MAVNPTDPNNTGEETLETNAPTGTDPQGNAGVEVTPQDPTQEELLASMSDGQTTVPQESGESTEGKGEESKPKEGEDTEPEPAPSQGTQEESEMLAEVNFVKKQNFQSECREFIAKYGGPQGLIRSNEDAAKLKQKYLQLKKLGSIEETSELSRDNIRRLLNEAAGACFFDRLQTLGQQSNTYANQVRQGQQNIQAASFVSGSGGGGGETKPKQVVELSGRVIAELQDINRDPEEYAQQQLDRLNKGRLTQAQFTRFTQESIY